MRIGYCNERTEPPMPGHALARAMTVTALTPLRSRLPASGTSIFSVMSALAQQHGAVNLGQGFPDYPIDPVLIDLVAEAMRAGHNQYPLSAGVPALREAIAAKARRLYGHGYDPEREVTVTTGATQGLFTSIQALAHPGDEVILFEPAYDSYLPAIQLAGATPVPLPLQVPDYRVDWDAVRRAISPRTRMIVLNTPNNPGTSVFTAEDLAALAAVTRDTPIVVVSDEVYEHMVYDGARHEGMARSDELAARSVVIGSFGKTFHATGWKVGYTLASAGADGGNPARPPVHGVHRQQCGPARPRRIPAGSVAVRRAARVLRPQARPAAHGARRHAVRAAAVRRQLFPAGPLRPAYPPSRRPHSRKRWCIRPAWRPFRYPRSITMGPTTA